ncbi:DUF167 domain-containing protein [Trichothermofontia sichuanensis B231]|uniref:DUF167 domain-containing protein n=1 Tax=Trichothermofontia sichuanensis TaxID=3045816 RepID=UPI00224814EF|nr:DUF167 domain-containing protein [Trichothermofontia sichuanensis]UZQ55301.1 DUF167 domain-containing protein [Trichothermofontia sichuanensis B231]
MKKQVKVKPNAKRQQVVEQSDGSLLVYLKSPPVDGKANQELIRVLADYFQVTKSQVSIQQGMTSRTKWVEIDTH